jgi:hypothetical protein
MTHDSPSPSSVGPTNPISISAPDTRLRGPWLVAARVGWLVVVIGTLALFAGSLPTYYARLQMPCSDPIACQLNGTLTAKGLQALQAAGISLSGYAAYTIALNIAVVLLWSAVGLIMFLRRSDDWVALLTALTLVLYNTGQQNGALTALAYAYPAWNAPVEVVTFLSEAPIVLFLLLFPDGRFVPRWTRWVVPLAVAHTICLIFPPANSPLNANNWPLALDGLLFISYLLVAVFSQLYRYRRVSNAVQRQQIKWAVFGLVLYAILLIGLSLVALIPGFNQPGTQVEMVVNTLYPLAALPLPLSIGMALLRYRLWDIDTLINKALVYGLLTGLLGAFYIGLILGLESLVGVVTGKAGQQPVVLVVSTLVLASLVHPVRERIQSAIDHRFYRKKHDAAKTLAAFSATLRQEIDLSQLSDHLLAVVQETMQPTQASLWLRFPESHPTENVRHLQSPTSTAGKDGEH